MLGHFRPVVAEPLLGEPIVDLQCVRPVDHLHFVGVAIGRLDTIGAFARQRFEADGAAFVGDALLLEGTVGVEPIRLPGRRWHAGQRTEFETQEFLRRFADLLGDGSQQGASRRRGVGRERLQRRQRANAATDAGAAAAVDHHLGAVEGDTARVEPGEAATAL